VEKSKSEHLRRIPVANPLDPQRRSPPATCATGAGHGQKNFKVLVAGGSGVVPVLAGALGGPAYAHRLRGLPIQVQRFVCLKVDAYELY